MEGSRFVAAAVQYPRKAGMRETSGSSAGPGNLLPDDRLPGRLRVEIDAGRLTVDELWLAFASRSGWAGEVDLEAYVYGAGTLSNYDGMVLECTRREALSL